MVITVAPLGEIQRPTEGFRTEIVKTKTGENQTFGSVLTFNTGGYYELAPTNASSYNHVIVVNTQTNVGNAAANADIDGVREVLKRDWEIVVKLTTSAVPLVPGAEVKFSATVPGTVDRYITGTDTDRGKIVGVFVKKANEWYKDVTATLTNGAAGDNIIIRKYAASQ